MKLTLPTTNNVFNWLNALKWIETEQPQKLIESVAASSMHDGPRKKKRENHDLELAYSSL